MGSVSVKDTVTVSLDQMSAFCKNGCSVKYARKLINDYCKGLTGIKGYWEVWYEEDDGERYWFTLTNPIYKLTGGKL